MGFPNTKMTLIIVDINCWDTEDWAGGDEVLLKRALPPKEGTKWQNFELRRSMTSKDNFNNGKPWTINTKYYYNPANSQGGGCYPEIKLYDEDSPAPCLNRLYLRL